ncbi:ATP-binding protein [Agaribacterium sp. ZY112]|uniref:ATP-binding protein n=1 Tax=Agaribacterium sp. ZY112 TaxID=3233574 RepID=UPI003523E148
MLETLFGKYRNIVISIALFLILDASVLTLNFYISFEIAGDAVDVNLAGRQRMLSQRMVKSLHDINYAEDQSEERQRALDELALTQNLFQTTLGAFDRGGEALGAGGDKVQLEAVNTDPALAAVSRAKQLWAPYSTLIDGVLSSSNDYELERALSSALAYGRKHNLQLLTLMNDLTVELEHVATSKATRLRWIQTVGISLAIINFLIILVHFLGQLKESDRRVERARKETTEILETVGEGLFLLDKNCLISSQYSKVLESMFVRKDLAGLSLEQLLGKVVSDKDLKTAQRFIALLFREEIKSNLVGDLNPLKEIEVNIADNDGRFLTKYFSFTFERVYEAGQIKDILVTVDDISERIRLEKELAVSRAQNEQQLEVLTNILHANPSMLKSYLKQLALSLDKVNDILREPSKSSSSLKKKLHSIFIEIHKVKGEASALNLDSFESLSHQFEKSIQVVLEQANIEGDDFLPLVVKLEELVKHCEFVESLTTKLAQFSDTAAVAPVELRDWSHLYDLTDKVASRTGKQARLVMSGLSELGADSPMAELINNLAVQGIRNAIVHGIEEGEEREQVDKAALGRVELRLLQSNTGELEFVIKDDGHGIDVERIRAQAIKSGRWTEDQLESWSAKQLTSLIFEPGFSTEDSHQLDAGAGVGLDLIKQQVNAMRGRIRIASRRGLGTKISVFLPAINSLKHAA